MALTLPNLESSPTFDGQSVPDATDFAAIGGTADGNGVLSGCQVTVDTGMTVTVASGTVVVNGVLVTVTGTTVTAGAASTYDRRDIVVVNSSGTISIVAGTPCTTTGWTRSTNSLPPVKPAIPSNSVILAELYVAYNTTSIASGNIIDKTAIIGSSPLSTVVLATKQSLQSVTDWTPQGSQMQTFSTSEVCGLLWACIGADNRIWVADKISGHGVWAMTPGGSAPTNYTLSGVETFGVTLGSDGNVWASCFNTGGGIIKCTTSGTLTQYTTGFSTAALQTIRAMPDGNLWAADTTTGNGVWVINPASPTTPTQIAISGASCVDLCLGPNNQVAVVDQSNQQIYLIDLYSHAVRTVSTGYSYGWCIIFAPDGNYWIGQGGGSSNGMFTVNPTTYAVTAPQYTGSSAITNFVVGPDNMVYFCLGGSNELIRFNPFTKSSSAYTVTSSLSDNNYLIVGPDNALWVTDYNFGTSTGYIHRIPMTSGTPGSIVARSIYAPSTADTATIKVSTTGLTALDFSTGGYVPTVTFNAPASGTIKVRQVAFVKGGAAAGTSVVFGITSSTASPGTVVGVLGLVGLTPTGTAGDNGQSCEMEQIITGLTPGTAYTYYFAAMYSGTAPSVIAQGTTSQTTVPTGAPCLFEVLAA